MPEKLREMVAERPSEMYRRRSVAALDRAYESLMTPDGQSHLQVSLILAQLATASALIEANEINYELLG